MKHEGILNQTIDGCSDYINKIPLDGETVTDECISGLAVRVFTQNVRGIRCDTHPRLKVFSLLSLRCSKEYSIIIN